MKKLLSMGKMVALAAGFVGAAQMASAVQVSYTYTGETGGGVSIGIHTASGSGNVAVGQFIMTTSNPNFSSTLLTYCTDIGAGLQTTYNYTPTALASATGVAPAWISGGIMNAAKLWYNDKAAATTATQTAGLQLAIWELLYNDVAGSYSTSTFANHLNGGFYITTTDSGTLAAENYAVTVLDNFSGLPAEQNVEWLAPTEANGTTGGSQGLLYQTPGTQNAGAPDVTSTFSLLSLAVVAMGVAGRKLSVRKA